MINWDGCYLDLWGTRRTLKIWHTNLALQENSSNTAVLDSNQDLEDELRKCWDNESLGITENFTFKWNEMFTSQTNYDFLQGHITRWDHHGSHVDQNPQIMDCALSDLSNQKLIYKINSCLVSTTKHLRHSLKVRISS